jgi:hypothetical protein
MFDEAFAPPRPCLAAFYHGVIDTLVSPSDTFIAVNQTRKDEQRDRLNALLNVQSELEGPGMAKAWKAIDHDARWVFQGCFILVAYVSLSRAEEFRLFDLSRLRLKYPEIGTVCSAEAEVLLRYTNAMTAALQSTGSVHKKGMLIDVCARISEGASAADKYKRGGGPQKIESSLREIIYENEGGVEPKLCEEIRQALIKRLTLPTTGVAIKDAPPKKRPSPVHIVSPVSAKQRTTTGLGSVSGAGNSQVQQRLSPPAGGGVACCGMETEKVAVQPRLASRMAALHVAGEFPPCLLPVWTEEMAAVFLGFQDEGDGSAIEEWRILAAAGPWRAGDLLPEPVCCEVTCDAVPSVAVWPGGAQRVAAVDCDLCSDENRGNRDSLPDHPSQQAPALCAQMQGRARWVM